MDEKKFEPKKLQKLNDPKRLLTIPPAYLCNKLANKQPKTLVEIGAGTALFSLALQQQLKASTVFACDILETMTHWVAENISPEHSAIIPVLSEEHQIPLKEEIADVVFMINLYHELDSPSQSLAEAYRLLRPQGELMIVDWKREEMQDGPPQSIRYEPERVTEQMSESGFSELKIDTHLSKHFIVIGQK